MNKHKKAFTLVELIVVITILAILGTIAFISLQGYSKDSRDSVRISDLSSMKISLELFHLDAGKNPPPTDGTNITYSGGTVWTQGVFGNSVFINVDKLDKIPKDPLTEQFYTYSVTTNQYELAGMLEGDPLSFNLNILDGAYAGDVEATAIVTGNYNGIMAKSLTGTTNCNALAVPTIIANDIETSTDLVEIASNERFVYNGYKNLPASFKSTKFKYNGGFAFGSGTSLLAYSDTGACVPLTDTSDSSARQAMILGLQTIYTGTVIAGEDKISKIINLSADEVESYAASYVNNNLGGRVAIVASNTGPTLYGDWRDVDSNCGIGDITIGTQTWAGCNSTIGNGVDFNISDIGNCYDYNGGFSGGDCTNMSEMTYTAVANSWFGGTNIDGDIEFSSIWGKFYTWANSPSGCIDGYHLPTDSEWIILENYLFGSTCAGPTVDRDSNGTADGYGLGCLGLGWKLHSTNTATSIAEKLFVPLTGKLGTNGTTQFHRGYSTFFWTPEQFDATNGRGRFLSQNDSLVKSWYRDKNYGYAVRCIKD